MSAEAAIAAARVVPVIRALTAAEAARLATALIAAGATVVELTANTPDFADAVAAVRDDHPGVLIGMGTVTTAALAERALAAGAGFLVSPFPAPEVRRVADRAGVLFVEGGFTPAEVAAAAAHGPAKVFPAHVGGPQYVRSLLAVLPGARLFPTGGIGLEDARAYLDAGALAVGIGSDLTRGADAAERMRSLVG